jgi:hypothetical protein
LTSATQAEKLSWKNTTKFMERPGCREYIFGEPARNRMVGIDGCFNGVLFWRIRFFITIKKYNIETLTINDIFSFQAGVISSIYELPAIFPYSVNRL